MSFSVFLGRDDALRTWAHLVKSHADWLSSDLRTGRYQLPDGRVFWFGWVIPKGDQSTYHSSRAGDAMYLLSSGKSAAPAEWGKVRETGLDPAQVRLDTRSGEVEAIAPVMGQQCLHYSQHDSALAFSTDLRLLIRWAGSEIDEAGLYSLFQYGIAAAPWSISRTVHRIADRHIVSVSADGKHLSSRPVSDDWILPETTETVADPDQFVLSVLDQRFSAVQKDPVLWFSGGVDSSLMAWRLKELGRDDVRLVNYSFGPHDEETDIARRVAGLLELKCEHIVHEPASIGPILAGLSKDYMFPFGDYSTIPTRMLLEKTCERYGRSSVIIDGTGADGIFGIGMRLSSFSRLLNVPFALRCLVSQSYKWLKLWRGTSTCERLCRATRRSTQMPMESAAALTENSLDGIAYHTPGHLRTTIHDTILSYGPGFAQELGPSNRLLWLDIAYVCRRAVAKSLGPAIACGASPMYPFMEPYMIKQISRLSWAQRCVDGVGKGVLKNLLARKLPEELVFRQKRGFTPSSRDVLSTRDVAQYIQDYVLSDANPLLACCDRRFVSEAFGRMRQSEPLSIGVHNFLWTLVFSSIWLSQLQPTTNCGSALQTQGTRSSGSLLSDEPSWCGTGQQARSGGESR